MTAPKAPPTAPPITAVCEARVGVLVALGGTTTAVEEDTVTTGVDVGGGTVALVSVTGGDAVAPTPCKTREGENCDQGETD